MGVLRIAQIVAELFNRGDRDSVHLLRPEDGQNVLVEPRSKIDTCDGRRSLLLRNQSSATSAKAGTLAGSTYSPRAAPPKKFTGPVLQIANPASWGNRHRGLRMAEDSRELGIPPFQFWQGCS